MFYPLGYDCGQGGVYTRVSYKQKKSNSVLFYF